MKVKVKQQCVIIGYLFSVRMKMLTFMLTVSLCLCQCWCRLVVEKEEDLYLEDGKTLNKNMIMSQAGKIRTTRKKSEDCPDAEKEENIYEFFVMVDML